MSPQEFKAVWNEAEGRLLPISPDRLPRFAISHRTRDFLTIVGLPQYAPGYLSFAENSDDKVYGIVKLIEQYDFFGEEAKYDKFVVIGSCRDGDAIAIDTSDRDTIWQLDHEDLFSAQFFNSSIECLADFLVMYQQFETSVIAENGLERFKSGHFTDAQFEQLRNKMLESDERAVTEQSFWKDELEIILALRKEFLARGPGIDPFAEYDLNSPA
jgi:hypothetical protein